MDHWHPAEFLSLQTMMHFMIHYTFPRMMLLGSTAGCNATCSASLSCSPALHTKMNSNHLLGVNVPLLPQQISSKDATAPGQQVNQLLKLIGFADIPPSGTDGSPHVPVFAAQIPSVEGPYSQDLAPKSLCNMQQ